MGIQEKPWRTKAFHNKQQQTKKPHLPENNRSDESISGGLPFLLS